MKPHAPLSVTHAHGLRAFFKTVLLVCASLALLFTGEASARDNCSVDKGNGYVWFQGSDNKLWVCWWGGSSYLAGPLTAADCGGSVVVDPVTHYCWYKGTDNRLRVCWYGGGWNNGPVTGATCASNVCIDHNNHYIWFQGTDNRLWVCWYSGGWLNGSVTPTNCHSSVRIDWNRHYVWYRGTDGKLYVCWWGGSSYLSGSFTPANCAPRDSVRQLLDHRVPRPKQRLLLVQGHGQQAVCLLVWRWDLECCARDRCQLFEQYFRRSQHALRLVRGHGRQALRVLVGWLQLSQWIVHRRRLLRRFDRGLTRGFVWYTGLSIDDKLHVCWFGGGTWNAGSVGGANCYGFIEPDENSGYGVVREQIYHLPTHWASPGSRVDGTMVQFRERMWPTDVTLPSKENSSPTP